ncbi:MAG: glycoside hydrolase family 97 protein [Rikenellaceae bacterium]
MKKILAIFIFAAMTACGVDDNSLTLSSPDSKNQISFEVNELGELSYSIDRESQSIIASSALGFVLKDGGSLVGDFTVVDVEYDSFSEVWQTVWGQQESVENSYNELTISLKQQGSGVRMNVIVRAFDDGVAFRYEFPAQSGLNEFVIMDEITEFNFADDYRAWWGYADYDNYEKDYYNSPISEIGDIKKYKRRFDKEELERISNTPMTVEIDDNTVVCIHEAELIDYPDMSLERMDGHKLKAHLTPWLNGDLVRANAPMKSPWRTFQIGSAAELTTSNMLLNLNAPCAIEDSSWIETFKYVGIWWEIHIGHKAWSTNTVHGMRAGRPHGATTENTIKYIDFAAANGFKEVLVEGWDVGWEHCKHEKVSGVLDWKTPTYDYDIERVCKYAQERGVRIMMYYETIGDVDRFESVMEERFARCNELGIKTIKMGYINMINFDPESDSYTNHRHGQYMVRHYNKMIKTAAKYKLMIVNHEPIKYTGEQRTYPNLMCKEGAKGQEYNAWSRGNSPEHCVVLPFTRLVSGPMDYTPGIFDTKFQDKVPLESKQLCFVKSTICKEMALLLTLYSPIQMAADMPENYEGVAAFQCIKDMPTSWSQSIALNGKIGDYYTVARKEKGSENWYIGSITDENGREFDLDLSFLNPGREYQATIYADGDDAHWDKNPQSVSITKSTLTSKDRLKVKLAAGGGQVVQLIEQK